VKKNRVLFFKNISYDDALMKQSFYYSHEYKGRELYVVVMVYK